MNINDIELLLKEHELLITILIIPALGFLLFVGKRGYLYYKNKSKRISLNFNLASSIICPNHSIIYLKITNNKTDKIIADKIELVLFDEKNTYSVDVYNKPIIVEPESILELKIAPVSHYQLNGEFVEFFYLLMEKRSFYFVLYNGNKKKYIDKKWLFAKRKINKLIPINIKFETDIHSIDWDYGFVYTDSITSEKYVGFMNKRQIYCCHMCTVILDNDTFTPEILMHELIKRGCVDIKIKHLFMEDRKYTKTVPRILGKTEDRNKDTRARENHVIIDNKSIESFTKEV